jgi:hypothetical protein
LFEGTEPDSKGIGLGSREIKPVRAGSVLVGSVAVSDQQRLQFFALNAREDRGVRDLVAVEVQHREDSPNREWDLGAFIRMPGGGRRTGFGLAVSYRDGNDQVWIVDNSRLRLVGR